MNEISQNVSQNVSERQTWSPRISESVDNVSRSGHIKTLEAVIDNQEREINRFRVQVYTHQIASKQSGLIMKALGGIAILTFFLGIYVGEHL